MSWRLGSSANLRRTGSKALGAWFGVLHCADRMKRAVTVLAFLPFASLHAQHWPCFRGPNGSGVGDGQNPPLTWNAEKSVNVSWKTAIPGLAHSSPVVWGDQLYVTTAISSDPQSEFRPGYGRGTTTVARDMSRHIWRVYALDKRTGKISQPNPYIAWSQERGGTSITTPLVYGDYLYTCSGAGALTAHDAKTGKQIYQERIASKGGAYSASPIAAAGRLYFASEEGEIHVVKAGPKYELLATNPVGEVLMATPAISEGMIFLRSQRQIYGIGKPKTR